MRRTFALLVAVIAGAGMLISLPAGAQGQGKQHVLYTRSANNDDTGPGGKPLCDVGAVNCTEVSDSIANITSSEDKYYTGHDEPSVLFYSKRRGSGNDNTYFLTLPKDPPEVPRQDGSGGSFNFQTHITFWLGMAMCDTQSAPDPRTFGHSQRPCPRDSDANIFDNPRASSPRYIGKHPGTAFMEMQLYPPGWVKWPPGASCAARKWCAALNVDSLTTNMNTGVDNNADCLNTVGIEPVNFAFITKSGRAHAPAGPLLQTAGTFTPNPRTDLFMNSGDRLKIHQFDTRAGFRVVIHDLTTGQTGSMTASKANDFTQVNYRPHASRCTARRYAFHPMYSTSTPHTRVPWAAHSYNVAFSDEIGHFEYCNHASTVFPFACTTGGATDGGLPDSDDIFCYNPAASSRVRVGGCLGTDADFDGVSYEHSWPGSIANPSIDRQLNPRPFLFTTPTFKGGSRYGRVAFETDLPRIEASDVGGPGPFCDRDTGKNCVNPPPGAHFYPLYSTTNAPRLAGPACNWQEGGPYIPGTTNRFGGSSKTEYGRLLGLTYPSNPRGTTVHRFNDFRRILPENPC
jgi:hypothetical protein